MFIAIVGTRLAGKTCVEEFLVSCKGFTSVRLAAWVSIDAEQPPEAPTSTLLARTDGNVIFSSPREMLDFVTKRWRDNFVTSDLRTREHIEMFIKRPFFLLVSIDAPLYQRYKRLNNNSIFNSLSRSNVSLEDFVREDDCLVFGSPWHSSSPLVSSLHDVKDLIDIQITNGFRSRCGFESFLEELNLLDVEHLRPGWDAYFMTLASLASRRSNCMKRRVGAVLVRDKRIIATGYNGTARGLLNCNEGGCPECNKTTTSLNAPSECVCLHAEENALLEAGRERIGQDAVLYCNTCPCLRCTVKIIQTGVRTVVYNLSYKVDDASSALFKQAGVELRRFNPSRKLGISILNPDQVGPTNLPIPRLALSN